LRWKGWRSWEERLVREASEGEEKEEESRFDLEQTWKFYAEEKEENLDDTHH